MFLHVFGQQRFQCLVQVIGVKTTRHETLREIIHLDAAHRQEIFEILRLQRIGRHARGGNIEKMVGIFRGIGDACTQARAGADYRHLELRAFAAPRQRAQQQGRAGSVSANHDASSAHVLQALEKAATV